MLPEENRAEAGRDRGPSKTPRLPSLRPLILRQTGWGHYYKNKSYGDPLLWMSYDAEEDRTYWNRARLMAYEVRLLKAAGLICTSGGYG